MNRAKGYDHYIPPSIIGDGVKALEWTNKLVITRGNSKLKAIKGGVK
jgi:hypothetical protein